MMAQIDLTRARQISRVPLTRLIWVAPLAMLAATTANFGLYAAAGYLYPEVSDWTGAGYGQIVSANIVYLFVGAVILAVTARLSTRPARHYVIVATIGLLLSLALPVSAGFGYGPPGTLSADTATVVTLSLMHIVSFAISVPIFIRLALG